MSPEQRKQDLIRAMFALREEDRETYERLYQESSKFRDGVDAFAVDFIPEVLDGFRTGNINAD